MPHRDPETGQYVTAEGTEHFDRIESVYHLENLSIEAAQLGGQTQNAYGSAATFEGVVQFDADEFLDRRELAVPLWLNHRLQVYVQSTQTADGTARGAIEVSFSPNRNHATGFGANATVADFTSLAGSIGEIRRTGREAGTVTGDLIGPVLTATGGGNFSDGASGVGGAMPAADDEYDGPPMDPKVMDSQDSVFLNGSIEGQNVSDAAIHVDFQAWWTVGVLEDD